MYSLAVFTGSTSLHSTLRGVVPINHSWRQKTGLPDGEDRIRLRSVVLTEYRSVTDGRTDGRTVRHAVAYTALAKLAFRNAVRMALLFSDEDRLVPMSSDFCAIQKCLDTLTYCLCDGEMKFILVIFI